MTPLRIHQEDLCQALGVHPDRRYQIDGGPAPADIARALRRAMPGPIGDKSVERFADALLWNWIIAGTDAHAKNYALLLSGTQVRLAPLYDVASALPYDVHERKLRLAMKLGDRSYRLDGQRASTWNALGRDLGLDPAWITVRAVAVARAAPDAFAQARAELPDVASDLPRRLLDAVADRAARCVAGLGRS